MDTKNDLGVSIRIFSAASIRKPYSKWSKCPAVQRQGGARAADLKGSWTSSFCLINLSPLASTCYVKTGVGPVYVNRSFLPCVSFQKSKESRGPAHSSSWVIGQQLVIRLPSTTLWQGEHGRHNCLSLPRICLH